MAAPSPSHPIVPGLVALHGNCVETLADALIDWSCRHPLDPLEPETVLVQSNGTAEWFKMRMAARAGVCAAASVELPARFMWRTWRQVLGAGAVPTLSPLDEMPMTWRLMRLLPDWLARAQHDPALADTLAPIRRFVQPQGYETCGLGSGTAPHPQRLFQLCQRLAALYDQYQVYRSDWLSAWEAHQDILPPFAGRPASPLPDGQQWQPLLWREVLADLDAHLPEFDLHDGPGSPGADAPDGNACAARHITRPALRARVLQRLEQASPGSLPIARRVALLGLSHVPQSMLEFFSALAHHTQVILAVPNPCRYHWADTVDGRELLRMQRRRQPLRGSTATAAATDTTAAAGHDLAHIPLHAMHAHAHPLLSAWGRQSRDYVRLLDAWDTHETQAARQWPRIDLFDDTPAHTGTLLEQVQRSIRDLLPLPEHPRHTHPQQRIARSDQSIVFHSAHSLVRELEVLHNALLDALAPPTHDSHNAPPPLQPRDIVVMLPDIAQAAAAIRAVFGQYERGDPRHIPFDIADLGPSATTPLSTALHWLLQLPQHRCRLSELCDLLDVPALAARLRLDPADAPQLRQWMTGCGIRWGLNAAQRASLDLDACGQPNTATFGLHRMLLGYATGTAQPNSTGTDPTSHSDSDALHHIAPYDEIGGLDAGLAGILDALLTRLLRWWEDARHDAPPAIWAHRLRSLVNDLFTPQDDTDRATLHALDDALTRWSDACDHARFDSPVPLTVVHQTWQDSLRHTALTQRFHAGGITFCTPIPMRAIPFGMVCLLGMNDGDYPRHSPRNGFDLMQQPGQYRPGDRARRDSDRQLMLDALLSARRTLYISWSGHNVRDNSEQPPSVLVSQLRDYLAAGWRGEDETDDTPPAHTSATAAATSALLAARTHTHPLQPFSRSYFEAGSPHRTHATEWRAAHTRSTPNSPDNPDTTPPLFGPPPFPSLPETTATSAPPALTTERLAAFLRHPARAYFQHRLGVLFETGDDTVQDDEPFTIAGLDAYTLLHDLQQHITADWETAHHPNTLSTATPVPDISHLLQHHLHRLHRSGRLPLAGPGQLWQQQLHATLLPSLHAWQHLRQRHPYPAPRHPLHHTAPPTHPSHAPAIVLQDWLDHLLQPASSHPGATDTPPDAGHTPCLLHLDPRTLTTPGTPPQPQPAKLLNAYTRSLAAAACGLPVQQWIVGLDATLHIRPLPQPQARDTLNTLLHAWAQGQTTPLPLPRNTALAWIQNGPQSAQQRYDGTPPQHSGECTDPYWARLYPDFHTLTTHPAPHTPDPATGTFAHWAETLYTPLLDWCTQCVTILPTGANTPMPDPTTDSCPPPAP